jgi:hypothetical protein
MNGIDQPSSLLAEDTRRLLDARRLVTINKSFATILADQSPINVSLHLLLESFISTASGTDLVIADALKSIGSSPGITWRWITALQDAGMVQLTTEGRAGNLSLTVRGQEKVREAIDAISSQLAGNSGAPSP